MSEKLSEEAASNESEAVAETSRIARHVWRKLDLRIVAVAIVMFFLSFLDRTNLANARVAGLQDDLKLTNKQYSIALTVTFIPYILAELPSNLVMKAVGPQYLLPTMLTLWGMVTAVQGTVTNYEGLLACRFFIGLLEGGLYPGLILYFSFFYPRSKMHLRVAMVAVTSTLAGAFSGLLAYGIVQIDSKRLAPWAWIFVIEGAFSSAFGIFTYFILPSTPAACSFLTPEEKSFLERSLAADRASQNAEETETFKWSEVGFTFIDLHVVLVGTIAFLNGVIVFGMAYFIPSIVQGLGYQGPDAQLMTVPPYATAFLVAVTLAYISDTYHCRGIVLVFAALLCIVGLVIFRISQVTRIQYGSLFFLMSGTWAYGPATATWMADNSAGHTRKATAIAFCIMVTNMGGILSTWLMGYLSKAPRYTEAITTFLAFAVAMAILAAVNLGYLRWRNQQKEQMRQRMSREEEVRGMGDKSAWFVYHL